MHNKGLLKWDLELKGLSPASGVYIGRGMACALSSHCLANTCLTVHCRCCCQFCKCTPRCRSLPCHAMPWAMLECRHWQMGMPSVMCLPHSQR